MFVESEGFQNNVGTAIHILNGNINMSQSGVTSANNTGVQGGAISLIGSLSVIVSRNEKVVYPDDSVIHYFSSQLCSNTWEDVGGQSLATVVHYSSHIN